MTDYLQFVADRDADPFGSVVQDEAAHATFCPLFLFKLLDQNVTWSLTHRFH